MAADASDDGMKESGDEAPRPGRAPVRGTYRPPAVTEMGTVSGETQATGGGVP